MYITQPCPCQRRKQKSSSLKLAIYLHLVSLGTNIFFINKFPDFMIYNWKNSRLILQECMFNITCKLKEIKPFLILTIIRPNTSQECH